MALQSINPATGKSIKTYLEMPLKDVSKIVEQTHGAFLSWRRVNSSIRAEKMKKAASRERDKIDIKGLQHIKDLDHENKEK